MTVDLTCIEVVELVTAYLDDALPEDARHGFEAHLAGCADCTTYLRQIEVTIRAARWTHPELAELPAAAALRDSFPQRKRPRWWPLGR
jgi:anti-sigma factor RsiW